MKIIKNLALTMMMVLGIGTVAALPAGAITVFPTCNNAGLSTSNEICAAQGTDEVDSMLKTVVNILLYIAGALSVIMLIVGGIRYTVSNGDSNNITTAKNIVQYSLVGVVVSFIAYAIVNWVLTELL